jgi:hypothetical protein
LLCLNENNFNMRIFVMILSLLNGAYMLIDGIHVLLKGKYIGPEKPGPWAELFYQVEVDVFKLGPFFIIFGLGWLFWTCILFMKQKRAHVFGLVISVMTLWYLPVGTLFSIIIMLALIFARPKLGL